MTGAHTFARIRGFISTARKQGWNIFESIRLASQNMRWVVSQDRGNRGT